MPTTAYETFNSPSTLRLDPWYHPEDALEQNVKLVDGTYARGTVLGEQIGANDVSTITISATGGTFAIIVPTTSVGTGATTAAIAYNAAASAVEAALEALACVGEGNVIVTGSAGGPYTITFQGALSSQDIDLTTDASLLTGGSGTAVVASVTDGAAGTLGTFGPYNHDNTDGTQHARCILQYACTVASGVLSGISDWGPKAVNAIPAYMAGYFRTEQLGGLDDQALVDLHATVVEGTLASGVVRIG